MHTAAFSWFRLSSAPEAVTLVPVLERLKELFAGPRRPVDVEYDTEKKETPPMAPAGPPTTPYPPVVPLDEPARKEPEP